MQAAGEGFDQALRVARAAGLQFTSLSVARDDLEPRPGEYAPDPNWLAAADSYYAAEDIPLALTISPIDTHRVHLPEDLRGRDFNDPEVVASFERLLDCVFTQVPGVDLAVLAIGWEAAKPCRPNSCAPSLRPGTRMRVRSNSSTSPG